MLTKNDLNAIGEILDTKLEKRLKPIEKDIKKLRNDLTTTINFFDKRDIEHKKNIDKTRSELGLNEFEYA